jgi:hypothetical protein
MKNHISTTVTAVVVLLLAPAIASADVVQDWNTIMLSTVSGQNPFAQARFAAITQLAVFEAVNAVTGEYEPYLGTITAPAGTSAAAAAIAAAHKVLSNYFPNNSGSLDTARETSLAAIPDGPAKANGIAAGEAAAAAMIAERANDGSAIPEFYVPRSSSRAKWQLTPSCPPAGGVLLHWRNLTPFGIRSGDQFRLDPPPALSSSRYARDYNEVKAVGGVNSQDRPGDRADVARFYAAVTAIVAWNSAATQIAGEQGSSLSEVARLYALLNMALNDGLIASMDTKYHYIFWRPETAIVAGAADRNPKTDPDASFVPFLAAPCFPSYPSAHAGASYAAREVLRRFDDGRRHRIQLSTASLPGLTFRYGKLKEITDDIDEARVYGGIHFRFDQEGGAELGRQVGEWVYTHNLRRADACECGERGNH